MNSKEHSNFSNPSVRIKLDNEKKEEQLRKDLSEETKNDITVDMLYKNEWHQEYELIYLSYVLER